MIFGQAYPQVSNCVAHACEGEQHGFPYVWADAGAPYRFAVYVFIAVVVILWWRQSWVTEKRRAEG